ncbi:BREX system P-loop protein BrxC [Corynebacterium sp. SCR221107]|uniref:BREX system P-loop protein BrxC n=1 Tax=Corynebacterium sp. SCR221107 TaxID=3017361 RepID=UPI0022EC589E|nr:BREX system P-loop protein BrxC [Corynebacterium sp. SCR221107]WBT09182.1 BREX system P-loop protein BrxC [Corynebacterium sp. SCR221107]
MNLNEIFRKDVTRSIEGVVKADDVGNLGVEVEEYVFTNDAAKGVGPLLEEYTNYTNANGVWISGFFGSGKSHLLKMLAHLLGDVQGQDFPREKVSESFLSKTDDEMLKASLRKAASIKATSLLFNIDQKATLISKDQRDALLKVFVKVFNESRGYFGNDGAVAQFEADLDERGQYEAFKQAYQEIAGIDWSMGREQTALEGFNIDEAFKKVNGSANPGIIAQYKKSYAVSIEDFATSVKRWLDQQEPGYRLNFFVDEVGQFIADDVQLMLNLQTIAESLNTKCRGRAWVFVTSQEDMEKVIGDRTRAQGSDFSKIQARFATKVKLTSQDVEEVISKRLLEKNEESTRELCELYSREHENFPTIFSFADGSKTYRNYDSDTRFINTYPFVTYQIPMFQSAIEGLSDHNMFEGRNSSVGERSMLGVVQEVAKRIGDEPMGYLATFDQMYAGISAALKSAAQSAIIQAEKHLPDPDSPITILANRLLKALFLVKYVDTFKATPRNLAVLMYDRFGLDLNALGSEVQEALALLERQSYVQRNGTLYEFLTNEEQEIEKEIKAVDIDSADFSDAFLKILGSEVLKTTKIRYEKNKQDFPFSYKLDGMSKGKQHELSVHFITPDTKDSDDQIRARTIGVNDELFVFLGRDKRLLADLRMILKTDKYIKQRTSLGAAPSTQAILQAKRALNDERRKELKTRMEKTVAEAQLLINGTDVRSSAKDAVGRINDGFQELVDRAYTNLKMLHGRVFDPSILPTVIANNENGLHGTLSEFSEAGEEVESFIARHSAYGEQVTIKKIVDAFELKPYGWDLGSIEVIVGWLLGTGKITLSLDGNSVSRSEAAALIRNTQKHQYVVVALQKSYDQFKVTRLREFCAEFFSDGNAPNDPTELAQTVDQHFRSLRDELSRLLNRVDAYPFLEQLREPIARMNAVIGKSPDWYLEEFDEHEDFLDDKEDVIDQVQGFFSAAQNEIYSEARSLLEDNAFNLSYLTDEEAKAAAQEVTRILNLKRPFGEINHLKVVADKLRTHIENAIAAEREKAKAEIAERQRLIVESDIFAQATAETQSLVEQEIQQLVESVQKENQIAAVRQQGTDFKNNSFTKLLNKLESSRPDAESAKATVSIQSISMPRTALFLESEEDVDRYLETMRSALTAALKDGKRIAL